LKVTVPAMPFTVPVKTSMSWALALPSGWLMISSRERSAELCEIGILELVLAAFPEDVTVGC